MTSDPLQPIRFRFRQSLRTPILSCPLVSLSVLSEPVCSLSPIYHLQPGNHLFELLHVQLLMGRSPEGRSLETMSKLRNHKRIRFSKLRHKGVSKFRKCDKVEQFLNLETAGVQSKISKAAHPPLAFSKPRRWEVVGLGF